MTASLITTSIFGAVAITALTTLFLDRAAQAEAWRRIADARRWNHDNRRRPSS